MLDLFTCLMIGLTTVLTTMVFWVVQEEKKFVRDINEYYESW